MGHRLNLRKGHDAPPVVAFLRQHHSGAQSPSNSESLLPSKNRVVQPHPLNVGFWAAKVFKTPTSSSKAAGKQRLGSLMLALRGYTAWRETAASSDQPGRLGIGCFLAVGHPWQSNWRITSGWATRISSNATHVAVSPGWVKSGTPPLSWIKSGAKCPPTRMARAGSAIRRSGSASYCMHTQYSKKTVGGTDRSHCRAFASSRLSANCVVTRAASAVVL